MGRPGGQEQARGRGQGQGQARGRGQGQGQAREPWSGGQGKATGIRYNVNKVHSYYNRWCCQGGAVGRAKKTGSSWGEEGLVESNQQEKGKHM